MDEIGNPIPGPSKEFDYKEIMESSLDENIITWLENEFKNEDTKEAQLLSSEEENVNVADEIISSPVNDIDDLYEEIKCINLSENQNNNIILELLERCNNFIDILGRNIVYLEEIESDIKSNIAISNRNADKAYECIQFEKKSLSKTSMLSLKKKVDLANFFKISSSNCPQNPHLKELYETGRLILSYNGRFILEECIKRNLWNQDFKNKLEEAIHIEVLDKIKTPLLEQHARLSVNQTLQNDPLVKNKIALEMMEIQKELDIISKIPFKDLVLRFMNSNTEYDWLHIAETINKPYLQCQRLWNLMLNPNISRKKWTKSEDEELIKIATKYDEKNWQKIAIELDTNRNEFQCFVHYQQLKSKLNKKGKWSKQEDEKLSKIVKENSKNNIINWKRVYFAMHDEGRSYDQIYKRWMYSLKPGIKKGFLSKEEKFIIAFAQRKNLPPSVVSMTLTNRTPAQIRNVYRRNLSHEGDVTLTGSWSSEEEKMLLCAVNQHAHNELSWSQVSKLVPGRSAEQCRHRFKKIEKKTKQNPNLTIDKLPGSKQVDKPQTIFEHNELLETNCQLQKISNKSVETMADKKLKKTFLENIYITNSCGFSSKCHLLKNMLDYLGADLVVPEKFVHKYDLEHEELMSMMCYLKEFSIDSLTLRLKTVEEDVTDVKLTHENVHDVLRTSDIINSDVSEVKGLLDIRMRNFGNQNFETINTLNSVSLRIKTRPLPLYFMGSVPPNHETFKMLYAYINFVSSIEKNNCNVSSIQFDWDNCESKKLQQRLVAISRWPSLFSGMINYNS